MPADGKRPSENVPSSIQGAGAEASPIQSIKAQDMKVRFSHKAAIFVAAVLSLSWFFEGWRDIHQDGSLISYGILVGGTLLTLGFLGVYGYWIYFEEKSKGTLKKRIALFEMIHAGLNGKCCSHTDEGEDGHRA